MNLDRFRFLKEKPALPHTNMEQVFFAAATGFQVVPVYGEGLAVLGNGAESPLSLTTALERTRECNCTLLGGPVSLWEGKDAF